MSQGKSLLEILNTDASTRPAPVCPGGMMSFAINEVMEKYQAFWPEAHQDAELMAKLGIAMQRETGFATIGLPFCMTIEAEALGAEVNFGKQEIQPWIIREPIESADQIEEFLTSFPQNPLHDRRNTLIEAVQIAHETVPDVPLAATVTGPVSLCGQLLETSLLLRAMRRQPEQVHSLMRYCALFITDFATRLIRAGAQIIVIAEPTGTGEILGPNLFKQFVLKPMKLICSVIQTMGVPVILHICGNPHTLYETIGCLDINALSLDETAVISEAHTAMPQIPLMGNIGSLLLEEGSPDMVRAISRLAISEGVTILAPGCGVTASTPLNNLRAMVQATCENNNS